MRERERERERDRFSFTILPYPPTHASDFLCPQGQSKLSFKIIYFSYGQTGFQSTGFTSRKLDRYGTYYLTIRIRKKLYFAKLISILKYMHTLPVLLDNQFSIFPDLHPDIRSIPHLSPPPLTSTNPTEPSIAPRYFLQHCKI